MKAKHCLLLVLFGILMPLCGLYAQIRHELRLDFMQWGQIPLTYEMGLSRKWGVEISPFLRNENRIFYGLARANKLEELIIKRKSHEVMLMAKYYFKRAKDPFGLYVGLSAQIGLNYAYEEYHGALQDLYLNRIEYFQRTDMKGISPGLGFGFKSYWGGKFAVEAGGSWNALMIGFKGHGPHHDANVGRAHIKVVYLINP